MTQLFPNKKPFAKCELINSGCTGVRAEVLKNNAVLTNVSTQKIVYLCSFNAFYLEYVANYTHLLISAFEQLDMHRRV